MTGAHNRGSVYRALEQVGLGLLFLLILAIIAASVGVGGVVVFMVGGWWLPVGVLAALPGIILFLLMASAFGDA